MPVKFYLGCDLQGLPHAYTFTHEENGIRRICQYMHDRLYRQKDFFALVANPCYTGGYFELNPDLVLIGEAGLGVVEMKHYFGEVDCNDPDGPWRAGGKVIEAGRGFQNPHQQVQSNAEYIRDELVAAPLKWLPGDASQLAALKFHTAVCFTHPLASLAHCRDALAYRYQPGRALRPWEKFTLITAVDVPDWAREMRFEVSSEADWYRNYRLMPGEVQRLATEFFHASPWDEMESYVRQLRQPYGYLLLVDEIRNTALPPFRIDREEMWIGRNAGMCNIAIPQAYTLTSNRHARLVYTGNRFYIEDLNSTNGTYLDGNPRRLSGMVEIRPGQRMLLGANAPAEKVCVLELQLEMQVVERLTEQLPGP
jgi:hypothetical protein